MNKKKAISTRSKAHGGNWISAVAAVPYADIFATGSCDGFVRVWAIGTKGDYKITQLCSIAEQGWINSLSFSADGTALVAAVGKVWWCIIYMRTCLHLWLWLWLSLWLHSTNLCIVFTMVE
eukprot:m.9846 g.9846  ORF g.9846 m.9846 type:complete len:121 (+) comp6438_c0_seq1:130-492(+)